MKTVIKALLAASMLMPIAAQAQEQDGRERGPGRRGGDWGERGGRPERAAEVGVEAQVRAERPQRGDVRVDRPQPGRDGGPEARPDGQRGPDQRSLDQRGQDWRGQDRRVVDQRGPGGWQDGGRDDRGNRPDQRNDWRQPDRLGRPDWRQPGQGQDRGGWRGNDRPGWNDGRGGNDGRNWNDGRGRDDRRGGTWNRGWRSDGRYDWNRNRQLNRGAYNLPRYYAPSGWGYGYRRFSVGVSLSPGLFGRSYWIEDPYAYRLPEAYGPYRWVRYYDDALLVDIRTGQVVDSVYGIFY